ncbi:uncharacterized protein ACIB01_013043 isoform 2-T2 [Guaruba guarouba]
MSWGSQEKSLNGSRGARPRAAQSRLSLQRARKRLGAASNTDTMQEGIFQADAATKAVKSSQGELFWVIRALLLVERWSRSKQGWQRKATWG